ncbi:MAG TPA: hypothetical protein VGK59_04745, partial [Ohtaekwangia sp.]
FHREYRSLKITVVALRFINNVFKNFSRISTFVYMKSCPTGKKGFPSSEVAEDVLIETYSRFEFAPNQGPVAIYKCDECGFYHLTSQGMMNERLRKSLEDGSIARQKEANRWLDKFKNR